MNENQPTINASLGSESPGIVMLFYGEGWGKSTAAFGYALRSVGQGQDTIVIQFIKGVPWNLAESSGAKILGIRWLTFSRTLTWGAKDPRSLAQTALVTAKEEIGRPGKKLVVLDEITNAVSHGWLSENAVTEAIGVRSSETNIIMTGRYATTKIIEAADSVTLFVKAKDGGVKGILDLK
ncbi:cob(I)yrinic acid a,c-diamide adenosyltransferase [Auritidibacter ignavus]|uniref:Cob(I)yrinic acid a,c-diamide adenosyltransferase n=1 Tax=Auritidibacter ignavus TaxID=678932 RepID=A0AAJ6DD60_9MICC|nr:cob(I)yrinic acid a,c-diamide adenosyltransferase [Auritidibacter ignavus]WGH94380.1 cob(I)yrinic acid a,c-diamide adenosyltransferase [Auritidibacter ignavus]